MTRSSKGLSLTATACFAVMLSITSAHATASLTYTASFGPQLTDWSGPNTPYGQGGPSTLSIPKFDPTKGTLESVLITSNATATSTGNYINNGTATAIISGSYEVEVDLMPMNSSGDSATLSDNYTGANPILSVFPTFGNVSGISVAPNGGTYAYASGPGTPGTQSATVTGLADLAAFEGTGNLVFPLYTTTYSNLVGTNASNVTISQTTDALVNLSLTYNYGVPEPASIIVLGTALVGLALVGRRKS